MAIRYSGGLRISVIYDDAGDYRVGVTDGKNRWRGRVRPAPAGFGAGVAYDSAKAYDRIAESALAFADDEMDPWVSGQAAMHEDGGWAVSRTPPGGREGRHRSKSKHSPKVAPDPVTYLSRSGGKYRVIHQAMPVSRDFETAEQAIAAAAHFKLQLSPLVWNGDAGIFE